MRVFTVGLATLTVTCQTASQVFFSSCSRALSINRQLVHGTLTRYRPKLSTGAVYTVLSALIDQQLTPREAATTPRPVRLQVH